MYAEHLFQNLTKSVSDKDRQFTVIPLLTRMLTEAFDEEVILFVKIEKNKMGGACSAYGGGERRVQAFVGET